MKNLNQGILSSVLIPVPEVEAQQVIVTEIEEEQRLVDANKELIGRFEQKINQAINRVWGEAE
jgi:type I restriction enzyme M protein